MVQLKANLVLLVFQKPFSKLKRITKELLDQVDDLLIIVESVLYVDDALADLNSKRIRTDDNLSDIKTFCKLKSQLSAMYLSMYGINGQSFSLTSLLIALKTPLQN